MSGETGSTNAAAVLTIDVNTATAASRLRSLQLQLDNIGKKSVGSATQANQIAKLEQEIKTLKASLTTADAAAAATSASISKVGVAAAAAAAGVEKLSKSTNASAAQAANLKATNALLQEQGTKAATAAAAVKALQQASLSNAAAAQAANLKITNSLLEEQAAKAAAAAAAVKALQQSAISNAAAAQAANLKATNVLLEQQAAKATAAAAAVKTLQKASASNASAAQAANLKATNTLLEQQAAKATVAAAAMKALEQSSVANVSAAQAANLRATNALLDQQVAKAAAASAAVRALQQSSLSNASAAQAANLRATNALLDQQAAKATTAAAATARLTAAINANAQAAARGNAVAGSGSATKYVAGLSLAQPKFTTVSPPVSDLLVQQAASAKAAAAALATSAATNSIAVSRAGVAARDAALHTHAFNLAQAATHATLRGVTGVLGGLWLSYAKLIPVLLAAAAATKAVKDSIGGGLGTTFQAQFIATVDTKGLTQGQDLQNVRNTILKDLTTVARDSVFTVEENADALHKLSLAGVEAARGIELLKTASDAAVFAQKGLGETTTMVLDTMFNFGLASQDPGIMADNFERAANVMSYTAISVNASFDDIAKAFVNITGVAGSFNLQIEEASALLANLAQNGIRGARAGTYVRNFFDDLLGAPISKNAEAAFNKVGIQRYDPTAEIEFGASKYIDDAVSKVKELSFVEQQNFLRAATNQRSRRVWRQELIASYNEETSLLRRVSELAEKAEGSLTNMAKGLKDSGKYSIMLAQAAYNASVIDSYQNANADKGFQDIGKALQTIFNSEEFNSLMKSAVSSTLEFLKAVTSVFDFIIKNQGTIKAALSTALDVAVITGFGFAFAKTFTAITSAVTTATAALAAFKAAQAFVGPRLPTGPVPITTAGRAAAVGVAGAAVGAGILGISYLEDKKLNHSAKSLEDVNSELADLEKRVDRLKRSDDSTGFAANEIAKYEERIASLRVAAREKGAEEVSSSIGRRIQSATQQLENEASEILDTQAKVERVLNAGLYKGDNALALRLTATKENLAALAATEKKYSDEIAKSRERLQTLREQGASAGAIDGEVRLLQGLAASAYKTSEAIENLQTQLGTAVEKSVFAQISKEAKEAGLTSTAAVEEITSGYKKQFTEAMIGEEQLAQIRRRAATEQSDQFLVWAAELEQKVALAASPEMADALAEQSIKAREAAAGMRELAKGIDLAAQAKAYLAGTGPITQEMIISLSTIEINAMADSLKLVAEQANLTKEALRALSLTNLGNEAGKAWFAGDEARAGALSNLMKQQQAAWAAQDKAAAAKGGSRGPRVDRSVDRLATDAAASAKRMAAEELKQNQQSSEIIQKNLELYQAKRLISEGEFTEALQRLSEARAYQAAAATQKEIAEINNQLSNPKITKVARQQLENAKKEASERLKTEQGDAATKVEVGRIDRLKAEAELINSHTDALTQLNEERRLGLADELTAFNLTKEGDPVKLAGMQAQLTAAKAYNAEMAKLKSDLLANVGNPELQASITAQMAAVVAAQTAAGEAARTQGEAITAEQRTFEFGWDKAFKKFNSDSTDAAAQAEKAFQTMSQGMESSIANFLMNPFEKGLKGMVDAFGQMILQLLAQAAAAGLTKKLLGEGGEGGGGILKMLATAATWLASADGNAFSGQGAVRAFAAGGAFGKGEVLTQPTFFRFAQGGQFRNGVAGEAGPEGALPLKRMGNGKLGVYAEGGKSGGMTLIQNINVNGGGNAPDVRRAAGQGAREGLSFMSGAQRYQ